MTNDTDLCFAPVTRLAELVHTKQISAVELVEAHLRRIEVVNPPLNAVVALAADAALAQARAADAALARGDVLGQLHGVPMTIKDSLDTAGVVSSWGTPGRANFVPEADATVVARLRAAGAILLGKTNTPELTLSYETSNPLHGRTNNPYDLSRAPGGSSGGGAALIAVGGSPFDIGSDTGGSIRVPAHCCGIAGLKPTSGRVPRTGHAVSAVGWLNSLTQLGPLARTVADLALLLPLIAGPDGHDPAIAPVPLGEPGQVSLAGLRVAFYTDNGIRPAMPEIAAVVERAAREMAAAGAVVEAARPAGIEESLELLGSLMRGADGGLWLRRLLATTGTRPEESSLVRYLGLTPDTPAEGMVAVIERWDRFRQRLLAFMADYDLILCPAMASPALPHGTYTGENYPNFSYTMTYNLTGWPAVVIPAGFSGEGLPLGLQIVAGPWREEVALAAAHHLETSFGGWQPSPAFA